MKVFTIDLSLNLLLSLAVLAHVTTCNSKSTYSSIMNLLHTSIPICDSELDVAKHASRVRLGLGQTVRGSKRVIFKRVNWVAG